MKTFSAILILLTSFSCSDVLHEELSALNATTLTRNFEASKGQLIPIERYSKAFITGRLPFNSYACPILDRQVYVCQERSRVFVVSDGVVKKVFPSKGKSVVLVSHGAYHTVYFYVDEVIVSEGASITKGSTIGTIHGEEADANFCFEIYKGRDKVAPEEWMAAER